MRDDKNFNEFIIGCVRCTSFHELAFFPMWVLRIERAPQLPVAPIFHPIAQEDNGGHQADTEEQEDQPEEEEGGPHQCVFSTERIPLWPAFPSLSQVGMQGTF